MYTQAPHYPSFAVNNTYGVKAVNQTVHDYMEFAVNMIDGCLDQIKTYCWPVLPGESVADQAVCSEAADMCNDNVIGTSFIKHSCSLTS